MSDDSNHSPEQYHPVEHKILSDYLKVDPLIPVSVSISEKHHRTQITYT